jgi:hypothetical protein
MRFAAIFRLLARFHLWPQAVLTGSLSGPAAGWPPDQRSRFGYACLMARQHPLVRNALSRLLRRERDSSPAINLWLAFIAWQLGKPRLSMLLNRRTAEQYPKTPEAAIAIRQADFADELLAGGLVANLAAGLDRLSLSPADEVVLVPASMSYDHLFQLWRRQFSLHAQGRIVVLAMDPAIVETYDQDSSIAVLDLSTWFGFDDQGVIEAYSRRHLWVLRVLVIRELVRRGHRVVSLDSDAILLASLDDLLAGLPDADIVAQRDYSIPLDVARQLGFILCCGFMVFYPTTATKSFLEQYVSQVAFEFDDQLALNHLIANHPIQSRTEVEGQLTFESCGVRWVCPRVSLVSRDLDHGSVIRHFTQRGETVDALRARLGID